MSVTLQSSSLTDTLRVFKVLGTKHCPKKILRCVQAHTHDGSLILRYTNGGEHLEARIPLEGELDMVATPLADILAALKGIPKKSPVTLATDGEAPSQTLMIENPTTGSFAAIPCRDYPPFPLIHNPAHVLDIYAESLFAALSAVNPAVAGEGRLRYALNGIQLGTHPDDGTLCTVATDGRRLAYRPLQIPTPDGWPKEEKAPILPATAVSALLAILKGHTKPVALAFVPHNDTADFYHYSISLPLPSVGWTIAGETLEGRFPDWHTVIPDTKATDDETGELLRVSVDFPSCAVLSALKTAPKIDAPLLLDFDGDETLNLSMRNEETGVSWQSKIETVHKHPLQFCVKRKFLTDALKTFGDNDTIQFNAKAGGDGSKQWAPGIWCVPRSATAPFWLIMSMVL